MANNDILIATKTASLVFNGRPIVIKQGRTTVREGHPLLDAAGGMFEPLRVDFDLEDAKPARVRTPAAPVKEPEPSGPERPAAKDVRAWAAENDVEVPARGKIPDEVYEQYQAAQGA